MAAAKNVNRKRSSLLFKNQKVRNSCFEKVDLLGFIVFWSPNRAEFSVLENLSPKRVPHVFKMLRLLYPYQQNLLRKLLKQRLAFNATIKSLITNPELLLRSLLNIPLLFCSIRSTCCRLLESAKEEPCNHPF